MSKKHKKVYTILNSTEHFLTCPSAITVCDSIATFASLVNIPIGIASSALGLKSCEITAATKKYKSIIKKKKKKHNKMIMLAQTMLNSINFNFNF